ncbi:alpha/beta hydrolase [Fodinisporobacter ferrooxydans]|uniref:Alpha/beta hydrolase n=1 Tax=Fodinisporobacter ferrooxydans TaxID=2901836 RepID=A0ABY4CLT6_9BACL|nr:alpha/beta hydrolase [Alicyclobacillaceae bacterium MYW30-H2]
MQKAIELLHNGMTLRGMEHIPKLRDEEKLPAVILFHGFTANKLQEHRMFLKLSRSLENLRIACFRFDFLGSGESDGDFEDMTVSKELEEAKAILQFVRQDPRIDPHRISLLGLSLGGLVASVLAGDHPAEIDKLVLLAPAGNMYEIIQDMAHAYLANPDLKVIDIGGNLVGRAFPEDLKTIAVFERAAHFQGQVLLIHGMKDASVPYQIADIYRERSYGSRLTVKWIEDADHTFNKYEWEKELLETVCVFLK